MSLSEKIFRIYARSGYVGVIRAIAQKFIPVRSSLLPAIKSKIAGSKGLEVGGPSQVFSKRGIFPVYPLIDSLDNCNFSEITLWEKHLEPGATFLFDGRKKRGLQYILEASNLCQIDDDTYDFVLSSHVIEHCANPLKVLQEWSRVLTEEGFLVIIFPHKEGTFDCNRPVTPVSHMIDDYERDVGENDETHFSEIAELHALDRDPEAGDMESFLLRVENNYRERGVHHHVFDTEVALELLDQANYQIQSIEPLLPFHILCIVRKVSTGEVIDNKTFLASTAIWRTQSPFLSDRLLK